MKRIAPALVALGLTLAGLCPCRGGNRTAHR